MTDKADIEAKLWSALRSDRTIMLGLAPESTSQPMTVQIEDKDGGPMWIFTSKETDLAKSVGRGRAARAQFASKGHDLFAEVHGRLSRHNDRATIDRLWNPFVAVWFEGGKDDPKLQLLKFDPSRAQVWLNDHSLLAGVKLLLGSDPKKAYRDKVASIRL